MSSEKTVNLFDYEIYKSYSANNYDDEFDESLITDGLAL